MKITIGQAYSFYQIGQRGNQEDARYPDSDCPTKGGCYYAVCDGVGGNDKGEVASSTVCQSIGRWVEQHANYTAFGKVEMQDLLETAYNDLRGVATDDNRDMATTLTFAAIHDRGITVAHIGDSRIYHIRPNVGIMYRSDDHSLVNSLVHAGVIGPEEAENHPRSNVITRCMTANSSEEPAAAATLLIEDVEAGDYLFLCSDGVLHCVSDEDLLEWLEDKSTGDEEKMHKMAERCRNSSDNNTAYLIPIEAVDDEKETDNTIVDVTNESQSPQTVTIVKNRPTVNDVRIEQKSESKEDSPSGLKKFFNSIFHK
ncbi:MAG: serine/threonine-protein phosphatase [Bacteroidales bacterium]|nr:serine/threonine-protein phosphatase [Bacteroidales bacterium]